MEDSDKTTLLVAIQHGLLNCEPPKLDGFSEEIDAIGSVGGMRSCLTYFVLEKYLMQANE